MAENTPAPVDAVEPPSAVSRVFETPDLLEKIMLKLPLRPLLLTAPSVSKVWRDLINNSSPLQQALFFQPLPASDGGKVLANPFLPWAFNPSHRRNNYLRLQPTLKPQTDSSSCHRMLVCQPPKETVVANPAFERRARPRRCSYTVTLTLEGGVTVGQVRQEMMEWQERRAPLAEFKILPGGSDWVKGSKRKTAAEEVLAFVEKYKAKDKDMDEFGDAVESETTCTDSEGD